MSTYLKCPNELDWILDIRNLPILIKTINETRLTYNCPHHRLNKKKYVNTIGGKEEGGERQVRGVTGMTTMTTLMRVTGVTWLTGVTEGIAGGEEKGGGEKTGGKSLRRNVTMAGQMTNDEQGLLKEKIVQLGQMDGGGLR